MCSLNNLISFCKQMIVKTEFHNSFVQTAVLYPLFSVTTNVTNVSTLNVKCQRFGMDTDRYTGCPRRNVPDFGRVFLMLKYTDITQNTYVQS